MNDLRKALLGWVAVTAIGAAAGCTDDAVPACPAGPLFTVLPVEESAVAVVAPIGGMNPPSHTVPSDHPGIYVDGTGNPLRAPGDLNLTEIVRTTYLVSPFRQGENDFAVRFDVCGEVHGHFGHLPSLSPALAALVPASGGNCESYSTADETVESCRFQVDARVAAGEALGTVGGATAGAFDFGLYDDAHENAFVNKSRVHAMSLHAVCPYEYFEPTAKEWLLSRVGNHVGDFRTVEPRCGTMNVDVAGTAQGVWVDEANPVTQSGDESPFVTLALDTVLPETLLALAIGPAALGAGHSPVAIEHSGRVNRAFSEVGPDGLIYCYSGTVLYPVRSYFISLGADGRLSVEQIVHASESDSPCVDDPSTWAFGAGKMTFIR